MELQLQCIEPEMELFRSTFERTLRTRVPLADNVIRYFLDRRGKQLRPILTILSAKMLRGKVTNETIYGAVAVEMLHNASLMHDDVIDNSEERRGLSTINRVWDNRVAVLTGDFFLAKCLICSNATGSIAISRILGEMVTALVEGELEQLSNARSHLLSEEAYFNVIKGKTASLFAACLRIGAHSVDASDEEVNKMGEIGEKIGLIFQIRDDIFDYFPSNAAVGKPTGHDIIKHAFDDVGQQAYGHDGIERPEVVLRDVTLHGKPRYVGKRQVDRRHAERAGDIDQEEFPVRRIVGKEDLQRG